MVLASPDFIRERGLTDIAWIQGMGWATEPSFLGDRDLATAPALSAAAGRAFADAGVTEPATAFDLVEITDATPYSELLAYDALSLCSRQDWQSRPTAGEFSRGGRLPVNLSGGVLTWNPVFCTGLIRIAEVANQVRGRAGAHHMAGVRRGLAQAGSGFAMQYQAAIVLAKGGPAMTTERVGIIGIGQSEFRSRRDDASYPELVREGVVLSDGRCEAGTRCHPSRGLFAVARCDGGNRQCRAARCRCRGRAGTSRSCASTPADATGISSVAAAYYHVASGMFDVVHDRRSRQDRRVRRFANGAEQDLGSQLRTRTAAWHDQHAGHVGGALHAAIRHDRAGHGAGHGEEPPPRGTESQGASAQDRHDR